METLLINCSLVLMTSQKEECLFLSKPSSSWCDAAYGNKPGMKHLCASWCFLGYEFFLIWERVETFKQQNLPAGM